MGGLTFGGRPSTAIIVMVTAGALLGLNLVPRNTTIWLGFDSDPELHQRTYTVRGWPFPYEYSEGNGAAANAALWAQYHPRPPLDPGHVEGVGFVCPPYYYPEKEHVATNAFACLLLLCLLAVSCEWFIRRSRRKT